MELLEEMTKALDRLFKWKLTNVPVLEKPVLIVFDYSPRDDTPPLSIAFDWAGGSKCWLSEIQLKKIGDNLPKFHSKYKKFTLEGREFHPFSIQAFPKAIFDNIEDFTHACRSLYEHVDWH